MAWQTITEVIFRDYLNGPELAALKTKALSAGQDNPLPRIISSTVAKVRGYVANFNTLEAGETVPSRLVDDTCVLIRTRLFSRLGLSLSQARQDENKDALKLMAAVAAGTFKIEEPLTPDTEVTASATSVVNARTRRASVEDQDGL